GAASPGPVNIIATSSSVNFGFKRTLPHVLGASASYGLIVFLVGIGLNQVLLDVPMFSQWLKYVGALFLLYMAYKIATSKASSDASGAVTTAPSFLQGALTQGLNPKAWLVSMSGVAVFVTPNTPAFTYLIIFTVLSFVVCFLGVSIWAVAGHMMGSLISQYQIMFNRIMGLLLGLAVVSMFI
ncbi:MAG: LysE family translocator, partial [Oceanospirillaceae bacterium]